MTTDNDRDLQAIRDRIAKYLRMAESTQYPEEAETFSAAAEDLMLTYGIAAAATDINSAPSAREGIVRVERQVSTGRWGGVEFHFALQVAGHGLGNVKVIQHSKKRGRTVTQRLIWFYGFESDVQNAVDLFESLLLQGRAAMTVWEASSEGRAVLRLLSPAGIFGARKSYLLRFAMGARARIAANKRRILKEAPPSSAVAVVSRQDLVAQHVTAELGKLGRTRYSVGNRAAGDAGFRAGQNARTGERELHSPRAVQG